MATGKSASVEERAPAWARDEIILALDLYVRVRKARQDHPEIVSLSNLLRTAWRTGQGNRSLRSPDSIHLKMQNFLRLDPDYSGAGMSAGSRLEAEVWNEFWNDKARLAKVATAIREIILKSPIQYPDLNYEDIEASEGRFLTRYHRSRERSREIVSRKKQQMLRSGKPLICEVCEFDFAAQYGERGEGFIECHHRQPLSSSSPGAKTKLSDLALVCSNCHSMLHRGTPWPSVEMLRKALPRKSKSVHASR